MEWKDFNTQGPSGSRQAVGPPGQAAPKATGWLGDQGGSSQGLWVGAARWLPGESRGSEADLWERQGGRKPFVCNNPWVHCAFITPWAFTSISHSILTEQLASYSSHFSDQETETRSNWGDWPRVTQLEGGGLGSE